MAHLDIARLRMMHQHLLHPLTWSPQDVVAHLVAVQAQDYVGAQWAVGMRMQAATANVIEAACTAGAIVRTHLLRPTWHFVTPADIRWLLTLTAPRVQAINAFMYRKTELDSSIFMRSEKAIEKALRGGQWQTRHELRNVLQSESISAEDTNRMSCLLMHAELEGLICSGPRRGKQFTYALLDERVPATGKLLTREEGLVELAGRYFRTRGPATIQDFAKWSGLTLTEARRGLDAVRAKFVSETINGHLYWLSPTTLDPPRKQGKDVHLLSVYDEYISSYKDYSAINTPATAARLKAMGNTLNHIIIEDGQVIGTWSRKFAADHIEVGLDFFQTPANTQMHRTNKALKKYRSYWKTQLTAR